MDKKLLLYTGVVSNLETLYLCEKGQRWVLKSDNVYGDVKCVVCDMPVTSREHFHCTATGENFCEECARIVVVSEMWNHYHKYHNVARLYNLFEHVLRQCTLEYEMHIPEKKHSWQDTHIEYLIKQIHTVHAKFTIADVENDDEVALEELIDLLLVCMMVAQRLFLCVQNPTIPM